MTPLEVLKAIAASGAAMGALGDASCCTAAYEPPSEEHPDGVPPRFLADDVLEAIAAAEG